jgi:hypothetical protein
VGKSTDAASDSAINQTQTSHALELPNEFWGKIRSQNDGAIPANGGLNQRHQVGT